MITINKNHIHIDDSIKEYKHTELQNSTLEDKDSWVFEISDTLANPPQSWNSYIRDKKTFNLIKMEMDELCKAKAVLDTHSNMSDNEYKKQLIHVASACICSLMEL